MYEVQEKYNQAQEMYKKSFDMGSSSGGVALAEYAMSGRIGAPDYRQSYDIARNITSSSALPTDDSAKLLMVYLLDRNPMLDGGIRLSKHFAVNPGFQGYMMFRLIEYHLIKVIFVCQAIEDRVKPVTLKKQFPRWIRNVETSLKRIGTRDGEQVYQETRRYLNIDELIYLCTTREMSPQNYDDFMLTNENLARKGKDKSAIVFELVCSLFGLLGRRINFSRAKFLINLEEAENKAILELRSFLKFRSDLLEKHLPSLLVDLVLEYQFSILTKKTSIWPGSLIKKVCIGISRVPQEC